MSMGLTKREQQCLDFIRSHLAETGIIPSYGEMATGLGTKSRSQVSQLLVALEERGAIRRMKGKARAIELIEPDKMQAVLLNNEIHGLLRAYAQAEHIALDTAANQLLRGALGAA